MHHYQFNIGDYRRKTAHLTHVEHSIYRSLIDTYMLEEMPLDKDLKALMRAHKVRTEDEKEALINVLDDFFVIVDDGYFNSHCDEQLREIYAKSDKARVAANVRWDKERRKREQRGCLNDTVADNKNADATKKDAPSILPITHNPLPITKDTSEPIDEAPEKKKSKVKPKPKIIKFDLDDMILATHMHDCVKKNFPGQKINLDEWANCIRMLREIDKRKIEHIKTVWDWAMAHDPGNGKFSWAKNIRSPFKFREKKDGITYFEMIGQQCNDSRRSPSLNDQGGFNGKDQKTTTTMERLQDRSWADGFVSDDGVIDQ